MGQPRAVAPPAYRLTHMELLESQVNMLVNLVTMIIAAGIGNPLANVGERGGQPPQRVGLLQVGEDTASKARANPQADLRQEVQRPQRRIGQNILARNEYDADSDTRALEDFEANSINDLRDQLNA
ncbi:hypothetical protein TorRG33x02_055630 [Trema orientale]|uniref:Uncharacterized protein n=1 Tax=Trema orientale TaxID=63057 RepID=A0A2P5FLP1_TREOI|nr:hypothetical protein TorRG33x02_055630 [Trema orientale]